MLCSYRSPEADCLSCKRAHLWLNSLSRMFLGLGTARYILALGFLQQCNSKLFSYQLEYQALCLQVGWRLEDLERNEKLKIESETAKIHQTQCVVFEWKKHHLHRTFSLCGLDDKYPRSGKKLSSVSHMMEFPLSLLSASKSKETDLLTGLVVISSNVLKKTLCFPLR